MFIRKSTAKNKNGTKRVYFQLAECVRINGKPRNRIICSLGRADDPATQEKIQKMADGLIKASEEHKLFNLSEELKAEEVKDYGPFLVFKRLFQKLKLEKVLNSHFKDLKSEFDVTEAIFNLMLNRLTTPSSKRQMTLWEAETEGATEFSLHQYYRAMDYLVDHKDSIEKCIFQNQVDLFHQELDIVLFDTTTISFYGEGSEKNLDGSKPEGEELLDFGLAKNKRSDLKQIVIGVLMSKEGIPLAHEVFRGNTNDVTCFSRVLDQLKSKYQVGNIVLVGDRGMISKNNIAEIEKNKLKYILGYRMRTLPKEQRKELLGKADLRKLKNLDLKFKKVIYDGKVLVVCYNEKRALKDKEFRERELAKLKERIKSAKNVKSLMVSAKQRKYLKISDDKVKASIDQQKVEEAEIYDGIFVLTTNTDLSCLQVVERYKDLWKIEACFRTLKSELQMGPLHHWKDRRIRAHIMICFMAFCLRTTLYKKLKEFYKNEKFSLTVLQRELKALKALTLKVEGKELKMRTELKPGANDIFRAIGMRAPNRIIENQLKPVVKRLH